MLFGYLFFSFPDKFSISQFSFNVIIQQVLGLTSEEPETGKILEDFLAFMRGLVSIPLYIPGTPYARAVQVPDIHMFKRRFS